MDLDPDLCSLLPPTLPGRRCFTCREVRVGFVACLEAVFTEEEEFLGIDANIRFIECGHVVPGMGIRPLDLAEYLNSDEDDEQ
jgi:hypothetical protein